MQIILFVVLIIFIFVIFLLTDDNVKQLLFPNNFVIDDNIKYIKSSADIFVNNLVKSKGMEEFKKYGKMFDIKTIYNECTQKLFNDILSQKNTLNNISNKLGPDDWVVMGYDNFVEKLDKLDPISIETSTLNDIFNNMKITANINYDNLYNQNNVAFPSIIGPFNKKTNLEIFIALKKIIFEYINNNINNFISNFDSKALIPKFDTFIDNYISSDKNYKDNFNTFSEEKLKPYIINELHKIIINVYNKKLEEIKIFLLTSGNINKILCKDLGGAYIDNACTASEDCLYKTACTYDVKEDCINMFSDTSSNMFSDTSFNMFSDTSFNMFSDTSSNIFPVYKNNKCLTSAQSGLRKLVVNNASNNDITYDFEYEKANITREYCTKKGLELTHDSDGNVDCKITKNKPILESVFGDKLIKTINTKHDKNQYEICNSNEIDGDNYSTIPENLKTLLNPLTKKYGNIEKSLCIENNYGCPADKKLVDGVCYNKCLDGYTKNPDKKDECYKLYTNFENNGELKNADIVTRKIVNNPYFPQNICPVGYNYNTTEKKCIEKCPDGYTYNENGVCKKDYPVKWDGIKNANDIKKNAISSNSKARISKCLTTNKPYLIDGLCYAECPAGYTRDPGKPYMCTPNTCPENEGYYLTGVKTCFRSSDTKSASYTKDPAIARWVCPSNYTNKSGTCWVNSCPADYSKSTEDMCMKNCDAGYTYKSGKCWANSCPSGYSTSTEGMCMKNCDAGYTKTAGVCYKCPDGYPDDIGALCRKQCASGYTNKSGTCWANSCPSGYSTSTEGMCMKNCDTGYTKTAGVCYKCPDGYPDDIGALCRKQCASGYTNISGTCWKDNGTYGVGVGTIPLKQGCDAGQRDDGTSCWEDWKCNTWWDNCSWKGAYGECIGGAKTDCGGCGCIKKTLGNRQYCDGDKELRNGLCYTKCASGYHKTTDNICQTDSTLSYVLDVKAKDSYIPKSDPLPSYLLDVKAKDSYIPDSKVLPSYEPPTVPLPSTAATCPSDRDTIDGLCYPKCKADYWSSSATTCETNTCPQNYYKTKIATCQRDADTKINPNIGAGDTASLICPEGVTEASPGGICYPNNPPEGYQRHSVSLEQWTEKCPNDWTDTGWTCTRPTKIVKTVSAECPKNYNIIGSERCKKDCEPGYEFKDEKCVQICPENTINNTDKTCGREKIIINSDEYILPYKYRIKKKIKK